MELPEIVKEYIAEIAASSSNLLAAYENMDAVQEKYREPVNEALNGLLEKENASEFEEVFDKAFEDSFGVENIEKLNNYLARE